MAVDPGRGAAGSGIKDRFQERRYQEAAIVTQETVVISITHLLLTEELNSCIFHGSVNGCWRGTNGRGFFLLLVLNKRAEFFSGFSALHPSVMITFIDMGFGETWHCTV